MICGIRYRAKFVDWCPTGLKCGINRYASYFDDDPKNISNVDEPRIIKGVDYSQGPVSSCAIVNSTSIGNLYEKMINQLKDPRDAPEEMKRLIQDYKDCEIEFTEIEGEEEGME